MGTGTYHSGTVRLAFSWTAPCDARSAVRLGFITMRHVSFLGLVLAWRFRGVWFVADQKGRKLFLGQGSDTLEPAGPKRFFTLIFLHRPNCERVCSEPLSLTTRYTVLLTMTSERKCMKFPIRCPIPSRQWGLPSSLGVREADPSRVAGHAEVEGLCLSSSHFTSAKLAV